MNTQSPDTIPSPAALDMKLEVVVLPVADVDRAKRFYEGLGWRVDADFTNNLDWRVVQMTPPGSPTSVMFGKGLTDATPGSARGTFLVVDDIEAARAQLVGQGVDVTDVFHFENHLLRVAGTKGRLPGLDPNRDSYFSFGTFSDPDGNTWLLQEIRARLPGRGFGLDVATMTTLLREAETRHGEYEPAAPKHHWSEWYAAYLVARGTGRTMEEAAAEGARRVERSLVQA